MEITCTKCGKTKSILLFYTAKRYQSHVCNECSNTYRRDWKKAKRPKSLQVILKELMALGQRLCRYCGQIKSLSEFGLNPRVESGYQGSCKICKAIMEKSVKMRLTYNLSLEDYHKLLLAQDNSCAVCKVCFIYVKKVCIDHDHSTNMIRGLLCDHCNRGLGLLKDNIAVLTSAINYLAGPSKTPLNGEHPEVDNPVLNLEETQDYV